MAGPPHTAGDQDTPGWRSARLLDRARRWRDGVRSRRSTRIVWKTVIGAIGAAVTLGGLLLVPLPGPGWAIVLVGLVILASEFDWAQRLLELARRRLRSWAAWLGRQPVTVRALVAVATAAFVAGVTYLILLWRGVPAWVPDGVAALIPGV